MKRSKTFGQILKVASYLLFASALYLFIWWLLKIPAFPAFQAHASLSYKIGFVIGWFARFYGMSVLLAFLGWLLLRWGNKKVKLAA
jgi:hypothetical protein